MRSRARVTAMAVAAALIGCGGGGDKLTAEEKSDVADANLAISMTVLDGSRYGDTLDGVERLVALCREKPDAKYDDLTVKEVAADAASDLQPYRPELAARLDRGCDR